MPQFTRASLLALQDQPRQKPKINKTTHSLNPKYDSAKDKNVSEIHPSDNVVRLVKGSIVHREISQTAVLSSPSSSKLSISNPVLGSRPNSTDSKSHLFNYKGPITRSISKLTSRIASIARSLSPKSPPRSSPKLSKYHSQNPLPHDSDLNFFPLSKTIEPLQLYAPYSPQSEDNDHFSPFNRKSHIPPSLNRNATLSLHSDGNKRGLSDFFDTKFKNCDNNNIDDTINDNDSCEIDVDYRSHANDNPPVSEHAVSSVPLALRTDLDLNAYPLFALTVNDFLSLYLQTDKLLASRPPADQPPVTNKKHNDGVLGNFCDSIADSHKSVEFNCGDGYTYEIICIQKPTDRSNPPPVSNPLNKSDKSCFKPVVRVSMRDKDGHTSFSEIDMSSHSLYSDKASIDFLANEKNLNSYLSSCIFNPIVDPNSSDYDELTKCYREKCEKLLKLREQTQSIELIRSSLSKSQSLNKQSQNSSSQPQYSSVLSSHTHSPASQKTCHQPLPIKDIASVQNGPSADKLQYIHEPQYRNVEEKNTHTFSPNEKTLLQSHLDEINHIDSPKVAAIRESSDRNNLSKFTLNAESNKCSLVEKTISYYAINKKIPTYEELLMLESKGVIKVKADYLKMKMETVEKEYMENEKNRIYELKMQDHDLDSKSRDLNLKIKTSNIRISNVVELIENCVMKLKTRQNRLASEKKLCFPSSSRISTIEMDISALNNEIKNHTETLEELYRLKDRQQLEYDQLIQKIENLRIDRELEEVKIESQRENEFRIRSILLFIQATGTDVKIRPDGSIEVKSMDHLFGKSPSLGTLKIHSNPRRSSFYGLESHLSEKISRLLANKNSYTTSTDDPTLPIKQNDQESLSADNPITSYNYQGEALPNYNEKSHHAMALTGMSSCKNSNLLPTSPTSATTAAPLVVNTDIINNEHYESYYSNKENREDSPPFISQKLHNTSFPYNGKGVNPKSQLNTCKSYSCTFTGDHKRTTCDKSIVKSIDSMAHDKISRKLTENKKCLEKLDSAFTTSSVGASSNEYHFTDCEETFQAQNAALDINANQIVDKIDKEKLDVTSCTSEKGENNFYKLPKLQKSNSQADSPLNHDKLDNPEEDDLNNIINYDIEREKLMERLREQAWKRQSKTWNNSSNLPHVPTSGPGSRIPHPVRKAVAIQRIREYYASNKDSIANNDFYKEQLEIANFEVPSPTLQKDKCDGDSIVHHDDESEKDEHDKYSHGGGDDHSRNIEDMCNESYKNQVDINKRTFDEESHSTYHKEGVYPTSKNLTYYTNNIPPSHHASNKNKNNITCKTEIKAEIKTVNDTASEKKRPYPFSPKVPVPTNSSNFFACVYKKNNVSAEGKANKISSAKPIFTVQKSSSSSIPTTTTVDQSKLRRSTRMMNKGGSNTSVKLRVSSQSNPKNITTNSYKQSIPQKKFVVNFRTTNSQNSSVILTKVKSQPLVTSSRKNLSEKSQNLSKTTLGKFCPSNENVNLSTIKKKEENSQNCVKDVISTANILSNKAAAKLTDYDNEVQKHSLSKRRSSNVLVQPVEKKATIKDYNEAAFSTDPQNEFYELPPKKGEHEVSLVKNEHGSALSNKIDTVIDNRLINSGSSEEKSTCSSLSIFANEPNSTIIPKNEDLSSSKDKHENNNLKHELFEKYKTERDEELDKLEVSDSLSPNSSAIDEALEAVCKQKSVYTEEYLIKKENDLKNGQKKTEQKVSHGFSDYYDDMIDDLFDVEGQYTPSPESVNKIAHDPKFCERDNVIDWVMELYARLKLIPETYYLAVNMIDRYITAHGHPIENLKLTAITCLLIAAKYESSHFPSLKYFVIACQKEFTEEMIMKSEKSILRALDYRLNVPNLMYMLRVCLKAYGDAPEMRSLSRCLLDVCTISREFVGLPPSRVAAISVTLAKIILFPDNWDVKFEFPKLIKYDYEELSPDLEKLIVVLAERKKYPTFAQRYTIDRYKLLDIKVDEFIAECKSVAEGIQ